MASSAIRHGKDSSQSARNSPPAFIAANRVQVGGGSAGLDAEQGAQYSVEEAAIVEERLKGLGYIE